MKYFIRWCVKRLRFFFFSCHAWSCDFVKRQHQQCHIIQCTTTTTTMQQQPPPLDNQQPSSFQHPGLGGYARGRVLEGWEWPKQAQTMWDASFGPYVSFFFFFFVLFYINGYFIVFIGCIYDLSERETVRTTGRIKTGPNDVRCIVWALGEFFCFLFHVILY